MPVTTSLIEGFNKRTILLTIEISQKIHKINYYFTKLIFDFNLYIQVKNILNQFNLSLLIILQLLTIIENAIKSKKKFD